MRKSSALRAMTGLLAAFALAFCLTGCGETGGAQVEGTDEGPSVSDSAEPAVPAEPSTYTVSFDTDDGTGTVTTKRTRTDGSLNGGMPADPERAGYAFQGWYYGRSGTGGRASGSTTYGSDVTLYACWKQVVFTVTFDPDGGSGAVLSRSTGTKPVTSSVGGTSVTRTEPTYKLAESDWPADPTRDGYTFKGWYTDRTGGSKMVKSSLFRKDTTLYARWQSTAPAVTPPPSGDAAIRNVTSGDGWEYNKTMKKLSVWKMPAADVADMPWRVWSGEAESIELVTRDGSSVGAVRDGAFRNFASAKTITLSGSVTSIGKEAFLGCSSVTEVKFGNGISSIGDSAFRGCDRLTEVVLPDNDGLSVGSKAFESCGRMTDLTVPNRNTTFGSDAFKDCGDLLRITIPGNLANTEADKFVGCGRIKDLTVTGEAGTVCGTDLSARFYARETLESLTFDCTGSGTVAAGAFTSCPKLSSFIVKRGIATVGDGAFQGCPALYRAKMDDTVTAIGANAFEGCPMLVSVTLSPVTQTIGTKAFYGCTMLRGTGTGTLPGSVDGSLAKSVMGGSWLYIPGSVQTVGESAFEGCMALENLIVSIDGGVAKEIGAKSFQGCTGLIGLSFAGSNSGTCVIRTLAFGGCTKLEGSRTVGSDGKSLTLVKTGSAVRGTGTGTGGTVTVEAYAPLTRAFTYRWWYDYYDGYWHNYSDVGPYKALAVPTSVRRIETDAFNGCSKLQSVYTYIGGGSTVLNTAYGEGWFADAFRGCGISTVHNVFATSVAGAFPGASRVQAFDSVIELTDVDALLALP